MEKLKTLRKSKKISQQRLADMCGVKQTYISLIETGKRRPSVELSMRFEEIFNVGFENFLKPMNYSTGKIEKFRKGA